MGYDIAISDFTGEKVITDDTNGIVPLERRR
jgi:hypothetical protein